MLKIRHFCVNKTNLSSTNLIAFLRLVRLRVSCRRKSDADKIWSHANEMLKVALSASIQFNSTTKTVSSQINCAQKKMSASSKGWVWIVKTQGYRSFECLHVWWWWYKKNTHWNLSNRTSKIVIKRAHWNWKCVWSQNALLDTLCQNPHILTRKKLQKWAALFMNKHD